MKKIYFYILCLSVLYNCKTSQKTTKKNSINNQLLVTLHNSNDLKNAINLVKNSGLVWHNYTLKNSKATAGIIEVNSNKKDFWKERFSKLPTFDIVSEANSKNIEKITALLNNRLIQLKTTPCHGKCPIFNFTINKDKTAIFNGINFVPQQGVSKFKLTQKEFDLLNKIINKTPFNNLQKNYDNPRITDLPSTYITHNEKQIKIRLWQNIPKQLNELHEYLIQYLRKKNAIK